VSVSQQLKQPQELSSLYGLALSASVCMADLVRQVNKVVASNPCERWESVQ
jgi:hypothetical protein